MGGESRDVNSQLRQKCRYLFSRGAGQSVKRILLIVIAIIVYGSLYPWDFHSTARR
jgi:hypothetical protein